MKNRLQIARFLVAGSIVNAADLGIYYFGFHFLPLDFAKAVSFTCAGILGYVLNKYWTFNHHQPSFSEIIRYVFINFLALGIDVLINRFVLHYFPYRVFLAVATATVATGFFTFLCFKWWVFKASL